MLSFRVPVSLAYRVISAVIPLLKSKTSPSSVTHSTLSGENGMSLKARLYSGFSTVLPEVTVILASLPSLSVMARSVSSFILLRSNVTVRYVTRLCAFHFAYIVASDVMALAKLYGMERASSEYQPANVYRYDAVGSLTGSDGLSIVAPWITWIVSWDSSVNRPPSRSNVTV